MEVSMSSDRKKYDKDFKLQAIKMVLEGGLSIAEVSRRLGVTSGIIGKWVNTFQREKVEAFPGNGKKNYSDRELAMLQKLVKYQQLEIEFLKKNFKLLC